MRTQADRNLTAGARNPAPLDLHEESPPRGCTRWPAKLRLLSSTGELVLGRCGATRLCEYCARLAAVETSEMLALDALEGNAPRVWMVLTTRNAEVSPDQWADARRNVLRALRKRWAGAEYVAITEFTTGYGPRSGGIRRPHLNLLLKNLSPEDLRAVRAVAVRTWRRSAGIDAAAAAQYAGAVSEVGGLMRYLALHFLKESQTPPRWWKGHRVVASRRYYSRPTWKVRAEAREALRGKRALFRALEDGFVGREAELVAEADHERAKRKRWAMVVLVPRPGTGEVRVSSLDGAEPSVWRPDRADERERRAAFEREYAVYLRGGWRSPPTPDVTRTPGALPTIAPFTGKSTLELCYRID